VTKADREVEKPTNDRSGSQPVKAQHEHKISASLRPAPDRIRAGASFVT